MVAPLAAAAARAAAPTLRSAAGKWMNSPKAGVRKMGGKLMASTRNDKAIDKTLGKMSKTLTSNLKASNMALRSLKKISTTVSKFLGFMAKHSPALKQQLTVMGKGFSLMIRPIGDIMAKFMRPMSIWVMKVAQKWYSLFGSKTGKGKDKKLGEDAAEQLDTQAKAAEAAGDPEKAARLRKEASDIRAPKEDSGKSGLGKLFSDMIPDALKESLKSLGSIFKEIWNVVVELGKILWTVFGPALKIVSTIIGGTLVVVLDVLRIAFDAVANILHVVVGALKILGSGLKMIFANLNGVTDFIINVFVGVWDILRKALFTVYEFVRNTFIGIFDKLVGAITGVYNFIADKFLGVWDKLWTSLKDGIDWLANIGATMWDGVKNAFKAMINWVIDKINFIIPGTKWDIPKLATGGEINTTGQYMLHAGERVLPAGETARSNNEGNNFSFNVVNNITATINNDLDIRQLADKLAELNETELRRRVSYF